MTNYLSSKPRYEILDGLRGVTAITLLIYHICEPHWGQTTQPVAHGYLAVDLFFLLSGFVIGYAYDDRWSKGLSLKEFMKRRITRLHPMVILSAMINLVCMAFLMGGIIFPDVSWGIGRSTLAALRYHGITNPLEFAEKKESWVRSHLNLPGVRTWMELNGHPCIDTAEIKQRQNICTSRCFGDMVCDLDNLSESIAQFAASCANKLRAQKSVAGEVSVFIASNPFREDLPQYSNFGTYPLFVPTADTMEITKAAHHVLEQLYRPGIHYKRSGVILGDIRPATPLQLQLFDPVPNREDRAELMSVIDRINGKYGPKCIKLAAEGFRESPWHVKCENKSGNYLTDINELLKVRI